MNNAVSRLLIGEAQQDVGDIVRPLLNNPVLSKEELMKSFLKSLSEKEITISITSSSLKDDQTLTNVLEKAIDGNMDLLFEISKADMDHSTFEVLGINAGQFVEFLGSKTLSINEKVAKRSVIMLIGLEAEFSLSNYRDRCLEMLANKSAVDILVSMVKLDPDDYSFIFSKVYAKLTKDQKSQFGYGREEIVRVFAEAVSGTKPFFQEHSLDYFGYVFESKDELSTVKLIVDELMKDIYDVRTIESLLNTVFNSNAIEDLENEYIGKLVDVAFKNASQTTSSLLILIRIMHRLNLEQMETIKNLLNEKSRILQAVLSVTGMSYGYNKLNRLFFDFLEKLLQQKENIELSALNQDVKSELNRLALKNWAYLDLFLQSELVQDSRKVAVIDALVDNETIYFKLIEYIIIAQNSNIADFLPAASRVLVALYRQNGSNRFTLGLQPSRLVEHIFQSGTSRSIFYFAAEVAKYSRSALMQVFYSILLDRLIKENVQSLDVRILRINGNKFRLLREVVYLLKERSDIGSKQLALDLVRMLSNEQLYKLDDETEFWRLFRESLRKLKLDDQKFVNSFNREEFIKYYEILSLIGLHRELDHFSSK